MRELEREPLPLPTPLTAAPLAVIGRGRVGRSLARAAELAGTEVRLGGGDDPTTACRGAGAALLCVPDAAIASNLLVALEESAAELLERTGIEQARELLAPLVLLTAVNWAERGPAALTGPITRGDHETVERHRGAIAETAPELLPVYDALAARAEAVARASEGVSA